MVSVARIEFDRARTEVDVAEEGDGTSHARIRWSWSDFHRQMLSSTCLLSLLTGSIQRRDGRLSSGRFSLRPIRTVKN